jgi:hypothetical protein
LKVVGVERVFDVFVGVETHFLSKNFLPSLFSRREKAEREASSSSSSFPYSQHIRDDDLYRRRLLSLLS